MTLLTDLEQATEGSRDLSDEVLLAFGWRNIVTATTQVLWRLPPSEEWVAEPSDPTRNLQDALLLVPEGWAYNIQWIGGGHSNGDARVWIPSSRKQGLKVENVDVRDAATPQLALCIACLRAMEAT